MWLAAHVLRHRPAGVDALRWVRCAVSGPRSQPGETGAQKSSRSPAIGTGLHQEAPFRNRNRNCDGMNAIGTNPTNRRELGESQRSMKSTQPRFSKGGQGGFAARAALATWIGAAHVGLPIGTHALARSNARFLNSGEPLGKLPSRPLRQAQDRLRCSGRTVVFRANGGVGL